MDSLHWHSLSAKLMAIVTTDSHYCACLGHLGRCDTDRIISIYIVPPKVAKESTSVSLSNVIVASITSLPFALLDNIFRQSAGVPPVGSHH